MARLWHCGFELQSVTAGVEYEAVIGSGATIDTTTFRSGLSSFRCGTTAVARGLRHTFQADTVNTTYHRFYMNIATLPAAQTSVWRYMDASNSAGYSVRLSTGGVLQMVCDTLGATVIGSSSALSTGQWYRIEVKIVDHATTSAQMEMKLDGTTVATVTGLTGLNGGGRVQIGSSAATTCDLYFDDLAINDTSNVPAGNSQTGYPGAGSITHMQVDGPGDNGEWEDQASVLQGSTLYTNVDEVIPDDATTYNKRILNAPATTPIDDWTTKSSSAAGIGSSDTVTLVSIGNRSGSTSTTATGRSIKLRVKSASGGTTTSSATIPVNVNGWRTHSASPFQYKLTSYTDPTTAAAWTPTGTNSLDNMQIGYQADVSSINEIRVSTIWALIEYVPSSGTSASITQVAATVTATGGTQTVTAVSSSAIIQLAATITATGGTQTVSASAPVNATVTQIGTTITATGGTQTAQSRASITQVAANVTATGGIQVVTAVRNAAISQLAATITAAGGTQSITTINNVSVSQIAANITMTGGIQVVVAIRNSAIAQTAATVTASGGTQVTTTVRIAAITQVAASVTATGGTQSVVSARVVGIAQLAANITASGGTQAVAAIRNSAITQAAATITATGGTQTVNAISNASITQVAVTVIASGGTQIAVTLQSASITQVTANVIVTGGTQRIPPTYTAIIAIVNSTATIKDINSLTNHADVESDQPASDVASPTNRSDVASETNRVTVETTETESTVN